jgi:hypothetical protein
MALNLWKIGGKPTSYNPLPNGSVYLMNNEIGKYNFKVKAYSPSGGRLNVFGDDGGFSRTDSLGNVTLTGVSKEYLFEVTLTSKQTIYLSNQDNKSDIIIDSLELVQKPLPKLTVNGVDGFTSGKWTINGNATVVNDETLVLNSTGLGGDSQLKITLNPNENYYVNGEHNNNFYIDFFNNSNVKIGSTNTIPSVTGKSFTTPSGTSYGIIGLSNSFNSSGGTFTFKRPMLNLGSTPAPYSRKTGDKMVLPVAKKNLLPAFNTGWTLANVSVVGTDGTITMNSTGAYEGNRITVNAKPNTQYFLNGTKSGTAKYVKVTGVQTSVDLIGDFGTFNSGDNYQLQVSFGALNTPGILTFGSFQLEEGTLATAYTPYAVQGNKKPQHELVKARTGLTFNGVSDYVDCGFPNITFPIQIETTFTPFKYGDYGIVSKWSGGGEFLVGMTVNGVQFAVMPSGGNAMQINIPIPLNKKVNVIGSWDGQTISIIVDGVKTSTTFVGNMTMKPSTAISIGRHDGIKYFSGIVHNVKISYGGQLQQQYDFENASTVSGNTLLNRADYVGPKKNLFDKNSNIVADAYLSSTGTIVTGPTPSEFIGDYIKVKPSTTYTVSRDGVDGYMRIGYFGIDKTFVSRDLASFIPTYTFTTPSNCYYVRLSNEWSDLGSTQLELGSVATAYEPYQWVTIPRNAANLIPNFEDSRWSLRYNSQLLGKDYLRLNADGFYQDSWIEVDVLPNQKYHFGLTTLQSLGYATLRIMDEFGNNLAVQDAIGYLKTTYDFKEFTTPANAKKIHIQIYNQEQIGTFDFIHPQLYALDGTEGTINGTPGLQRKASKRTQYAKR